MPSALLYSPTLRPLQAAANTERREREALHDRNHAYYAGRHRQHLKADASGHDDNVVLNLCRQTIDRTLAFLVPDFPHLQLDPLRNTDDEQWLQRAWRHSGDAVLLAGMALNGALNGHVFIRVLDGQPYPRIINLNPRQVLVYWDADDRSRVLWYELRWQDGQTQWRQDIINEGDRWLIREFQLKAARWELMDEIIWPYALGPIVDWQHLPNPTHYYGAHELQHAALNDTVNKVASDIARILRFHAFPRTIGTGFEAGAVQRTAIDDFWTIADPAARVFNLEMQGDLGTSMGFLQLLTDAFLAESRVTMLHGDPNSVKGVTNLAIRALYMDMIAKNAVLRRSYGEGLIALSQRLLMLAGRDVGEMLRVQWPDALPSDQREQVDVVSRQVELGVMSPTTAAIRLGLDPALDTPDVS